MTSQRPSRAGRIMRGFVFASPPASFKGVGEPRTRHVTDPIRAWKNAYWADDEFHAIAAGQTYGVDERATCVSGAHAAERSPVLRCACGFYAFKRPSLATHELSVYLPQRNPTAVDYLTPTISEAEYTPETMSVLLEVNLSGRIIGHERGYRAERQQIISVYACPAAFDTKMPARLEAVHHIPVRSIERLRAPEHQP